VCARRHDSGVTAQVPIELNAYWNGAAAPWRASMADAIVECACTSPHKCRDAQRHATRGGPQPVAARHECDEYVEHHRSGDVNVCDDIPRPVRRAHFLEKSRGDRTMPAGVALAPAITVPVSLVVTMNTWKYFVPVALLAAAVLLTSGAPLYSVVSGIVLAALVIWVSNRGRSDTAR
jgi:hypothetical protein